MSGRRTRLVLRPEVAFHLAHTAASHGWVMLAPNAWDAEAETIRRVHRLPSGRVVLLEVREAGATEAAERGSGAGPPGDGGGDGPGETGRELIVGVEHEGRLTAADRRAILDDVSRMLRLGEDLSEFYDLCAERGGPWAGVTGGFGRLLRSPTVFEDVVKTICTTNVQWGGTTRMARELVEEFGAPYPGTGGDPGAAPDAPAGGPSAAPEGPADGSSWAPRGAGARAFPTPEAIAGASGEEFAERVGLGYRAPYVHELASRVCAGELDLEALALSPLPTPELKAELLSIKGVGPYAAATLLMLLGRYDEPAVDSVFREFVGRRYFGGRSPTDAEARGVYEPWGRWKYLAYWFEVWTDHRERRP